MKKILLIAFLFSSTGSFAQRFLEVTPQSRHWADSTIKKLSKKQKIAQLMVIRTSTTSPGGVKFFEEDVLKYIRKYNIGSICLFQGTSLQQALLINKLQEKAKTPLMVCVDGETGLGMRFSDVIPFPDQLTIGAVQNPSIAYHAGEAIAAQCKRIGIQVDYAPVVDINNNPANPVINFRSFGEDKYKVATFGSSIMKGMQDNGVLACAKHFPGHGDVSVDSHYDLPVINKSFAQLDELELYPFKTMIKDGIGSVMVAHLYIPAIDSTTNRATSLSPNNVSKLLRQDLGFKGLTFTDALEMKGVAKFYPQGEAAVQSLIAGNDMLCLPGDIKGSIRKIRKAVRKKNLSWADIDEKVNRVLLAKYNLGLNQVTKIDTTSLTHDLNAQTDVLKQQVYKNAITLLRNDNGALLNNLKSRKVAYVGIGLDKSSKFGTELKSRMNADAFFLPHTATQASADSLLQLIGDKYDVVFLGVHKYKKYPAANFGVSKDAVRFISTLGAKENVFSFIFGNPYLISNFSENKNLVACYEDDPLMHDTAIDFIEGRLVPGGTLPVTVSSRYQFGAGISAAPATLTSQGL
ncbi:MAG: glycoside hydrolase family 3 protein [Arcticibacter sp.]